MSGVGLWYASGTMSRARTVLVLAVTAAVSLPGTEIITRSWYHRVYLHYALKTVPLLVMWCVIETELSTGETGQRDVTPMEPRGHRGGQQRRELELACDGVGIQRRQLRIRVSGMHNALGASR